MKPKIDNLPNFTVIESQILIDNNITSAEKLLYSYICLLTNNKKLSCFATTKYLSNIFNTSERQIRRYLSNLKKHNYITVRILNGNKREINTTLNTFLENRHSENLKNDNFEDVYEYDWLKGV